jgi:hypothetical protein
MNDEVLIWEAYKKNKNPYKQEVERVMEMYPDQYDNWRKELNAKISQAEYDSPEYNHLNGLERALEHEYIPSKELWEKIWNTVNDESSSLDSDFTENLFQITTNAHNNVLQYEGTPSYYRRCIGTLQINLGDGEHNTPEVREWFETKFGIIG